MGRNNQPGEENLQRADLKVAEREGFEPSEHLVGIHAISSRAPSATRASLLT